MNPLLILLIGMTVVIGGILLLRLHAFLSLMAGALAVALLTPTLNVYRFTLRSGGVDIVGFDPSAHVVLLKSKQKLLAGTPLLVLQPANTASGYRQAATLRVTGQDAEGRILATIASGDVALPLPKQDFVVEPVKETAAKEAADQTIGERIAV